VEKIRHNFLQAQFDPSATENAERPVERRRLMYVVGKSLELEYSVRGMARATAEGLYAKAMQRRVRSAVSTVQDLHARLEIPELENMLTAVSSVNVKPGNEESLVEAADKIGTATKAMIDNHDGTQWAAIDPALEGQSLPPLDIPVPEAPPQQVADQGSTESAPAPTTAQTATATTSTISRPEGLPPIKNRIRPASDHETIGPNNCSCHRHTDQNNWWFNDAHYTSVDPFFSPANPKNVQIARLYGINPANMTRGDNLCMDCHGTVVSGQESQEVFDGVSCESCHGGAKDYHKPHQEGDPAAGVNRAGYKKALELGMNELKNLDVRARQCASCHYVTEPRLLSSGHPSGRDFDFAAGNKKIKHWPTELDNAATLSAAYSGALEARGAVPDIQLITQTSSGPSGQSGAPRQATAQQASAGQLTDRSKPARQVPPRPRPVDPGAPVPQSVGPIELPDFPEITDSTAFEDALLKLKERLELLYDKVNK
jgi:hypothetical protein